MTKALIDRIKIGCFGLDPIDPLRLLLDEVIEALAQPTSGDYTLGYCEGFNDAKVLDWNTTPPQHTWVGLKLSERNELCRAVAASTHQVRAIEAKLKEKNT